jgi:GNAT superfamily N-acetyltransferase
MAGSLRSARLDDYFQRTITMNEPNTAVVQVTYMELRESPAPPIERRGVERIARERLSLTEYLTLYRNVGEPLRWDQRLRMPEAELGALLDGGLLSIYVLRNLQDHALGFCEFDLSAFPEIELKNFGLIPAAQGGGLGPWLLTMALREVWRSGPKRIWLHTDSWDHPAAIRVYERAGFRAYDVRHEAPGML